MDRQKKSPVAAAIFYALGMFAVTRGTLFAEVAQTPALSTAPVSVEVSTPAPATPPAVTTPIPAEVKPAAAAPTTSLEFVGATTCLSCHENQNHFKDSVHGRAFAQLKGIALEQSCETCHGPGSLHAAAAGDKSNPGYATIKIFKGMSAVNLEKTCLQCHQDENRIHWVGSVHERRNVSCLACHSVHSAKEEKLLLVQPKIDLVCAQCHKDIVAKINRSEHMPLVEGKMDCTSCHNPHGSATPKLLKANSGNDTCYSCHADKRGPFVWEHPPVRENCMNCHDPHGSHHEFMLVARRPFLCQRCHDSSRHPSTPYDNTYIAKGGNRIVAEACTNCHSNIHGSNHPSGRYFTR